VAEISITVYSKDECCLCDVAKEVIIETLQRMELQHEVPVVTVDITKDKMLHEKYKNDIPVVTINDEFAFRYKVHPITLEKKLVKTMKTPL